MSYLQDKKLKNKKIQKIAILVVILFLVFYFRVSILKGLSSTFSFIAHPFLVVGNSVGIGFNNFGTYFSSKKNLSLENDILKSKLVEGEARMSNYNSVLDENLKMKEILNRKNSKKDFILAGILAKPNRSLYDTFLIDVGSDNGVLVGQKVFAVGDVPIGYISEVYTHSSRVILYSNPGEKTDAVVSGHDTFMQIVGRGGGNFEMSLPRDLVIEKGAEVVLPGITPHTVAIVATILSDPRDSYQKALLASPVNLFELKFVELEK